MTKTSFVGIAAVALVAGVVGLQSQAPAGQQAPGGAQPEAGRGGRAGAPAEPGAAGGGRAGRAGGTADQGAPAGRGGGAATFDYGWKSEEYLLLGDTNRGAGEPQIAVDPTNPKNIIVVAMASLQQVAPNAPARNLTGRSTITTLAVTHNGGFTWTTGELPILYNDTLRCPDSIADVTKDGKFLAGCEIRQTQPGGTEGSYFMISGDKGVTWGPRVDFIGWSTERFAPGLRPRVGGAQPYDRPYLAIDDSTGVIYGVAQGGTAVVAPDQTKPQAYITASTDGGKSFGTIYAWDMNGMEYPQIGRGAGQAAGHGEVAVLYTAASVPAREQAGPCPCPVVGVSRDLGKTFTYRVVKGLSIGTSPAGGPPANPPSNVADLTLDPTTAGRFAVLAYVAGTTPRFDVVVSEDHGQTWSAPVVAGTTPNATSFTKPAFKYSRQAGVLGLMWRAIYRDGTYDIWSAISKDGGKTFSRPLRVSHAVSPASDPIRVGANDDIQDLAMDAENLHMVWGDARAGFQGVFYGRVAFSAYEFAR